MRPIGPAAAAALSAAALVAASCATLSESGGGDETLPNAEAGPFRDIAQTELGNSRAAPYAMNDGDRFARDPSVLDLDGDPTTLEAAGFFAVTLPPGEEPADPGAPPNAIVRSDALDGRSFDRALVTVLEPEEAWEGGTVGAPSALRVGAEIWLYYAAAGGIGLARSGDGLSFTREPLPVLAPLTGGWEQGAVPANPGAIVLPDGSFRMFYEVPGEGGASSIGEARSTDGITWERVGAAPALAPSPPAAGAQGAAGPPGRAMEPTGVSGAEEPYDGLAVGDPAPVLATSSTGRASLRLYHTAHDRTGKSTIALAARFNVDGSATENDREPFQRAAAPVFGSSSSLDPRSPCVVVYSDVSILFATQRAGTSDSQAYPAVAAGVAPANASLPPPEPP